MSVKLAKKFWELDRVVLKGEAGSVVGEWGKQCWAASFLVIVCVWAYFCCCSEGCLC
jgi:hypothetical protein